MFKLSIVSVAAFVNVEALKPCGGLGCSRPNAPASVNEVAADTVANTAAPPPLNLVQEAVQNLAQGENQTQNLHTIQRFF